MFRFTAAALSLLAFGDLKGVIASASYHMERPMGDSPHMWTFGAEGVSIYKPDGSMKLKSVGPDKACLNVTSGTDYRVRCDFYDVVSDGKKYVWAAVARGGTKINVFSLQTGDLVGSFPTCSGVYDMDYHPVREEIWVHCAKFTDMENSHMDVFSTVAPSIPITSNVVLHDDTAMRSFGRLETDASLGDKGYATVYGSNMLHEIDLSERKVKQTIELGKGNSDIYGLYELTYSRANEHIFTRTQVCCTCGFEGADLQECGRYGSENITVNGEVVEGQCGRHCEGGPTDTVGIYEFNTRTNEVVGSHSMVGSGNADAAFTSPDGEHIIMFGMNGGKKVHVLEAGENGQKSKLKYEIELDFNITNVEDMPVYDDFAFVNHNGVNIFVLSSSNEHKVAIVDLSGNKPTASYVKFKNTDFSGRARTRQVEWVYGTDYVWVSGREQDEVYVIDVIKKQLVNTISIEDPRKLLSVINYEFVGFSNQLDKSWGESRVFENRFGALNSASSSSSDEGNSNTMSIVAIVLSCIAIVAVVVNVVTSKSSSANSGGKASRDEEASIGVPSVN